MQIAEKLAKKAKDNRQEAPVTIAFYGDSVTQGCFELYKVGEAGHQTVFDKTSVYHAKIAQILSVLYPTVPVNIINAGISGNGAKGALKRLERDVLKFHPDLTVVCFGLNDSGGGLEGLQDYKDSLEQIFSQLEDVGSEIIFMTPNMMATEVSCHVTDSHFIAIAEDACKRQNEAIMDQYMQAAKEVCAQQGVRVCDCYEKWKALAASGVDVTELLANKINHPTREMHWLFAYSLVETMLM
ncbi:MAG: hypothetical protein IKK59_00805 [Lachnospiraceae bacterium]|nr:hypothetical protein [Lachnospiraceae bacterium]